LQLYHLFNFRHSQFLISSFFVQDKINLFGYNKFEIYLEVHSMNLKVKQKVWIDIAMSLLFLLLMNLSITGVVWHEVFGFGILGLFVAHLVINRQWITSVAKRFHERIGFRAKAMFVLNTILLCTMGLTVFSGFLVSEYLFPFLASSNIGFWMNIHTISSWLTLAVLVIHTLFHWRWIGNVIRRMIPEGGLRVIAARATLALLAILAVYSLISNSALDIIWPNRLVSEELATSAFLQSMKTTVSAGSANAVQETADLVIRPIEEKRDLSVATTSTITTTTRSPQTQSTTVSSATTATISKQTTPAVISVTTPETQSTQTLQKYLSSLRCTACSKHCLLTNPRCGKGKTQAQKATAVYNSNLESNITIAYLV
jgi:hypothetical protein